jgi:hypothetical protein
MFYGLAKHEKDIYQHKINLFIALAPVNEKLLRRGRCGPPWRLS